MTRRLLDYLRRLAAVMAVVALAMVLTTGACWFAGLPMELATALPVAVLVLLAWWQVFAVVWETAIRFTGGRK